MTQVTDIEVHKRSTVFLSQARLELPFMSIPDFKETASVLEGIGMAEAGGEPFLLERASDDLGVPRSALQIICNQAEQAGLISPNEAGVPVLLTQAGRQYLAREGRIRDDALFFLSEWIDDLWAREALLRAGTILVDEFRGALLEDRGEEYAADLVPTAFEVAIDGLLTINLFAAAVALMARLSSGHAAGCLAEEIVAVELLQQARALLDLQHETGELGADEASAATEEVRGLFDLFEDSDVLRMFEMREPSDAALAEHSPVNRILGTSDQRVETWFDPFGPVADTGHLSDLSGSSDGDD